ncbi:hypothetical protein JZ751_020617 [Albula glossodonta]|uniref:Uncharacterized protein n=1 Tax=Albula glossodonta TaxID=121402 RepID=A0A8T2PI89_9TELE|nr:hypothetical protein JZ751_020617 [Albula glossodonta]
MTFVACFNIALATLAGVAGGVYVYRPMFEPLNKDSGHSSGKQEDAKVPQSSEKLDVKEDPKVKNS